VAAPAACSQRANPYIAEAHGVAVVLEVKRALLHETFERRRRGGLGSHRNMVLDEHAVMQHRVRAGLHLAVGELLRGMEDDVVSLPLARFAARIDQRRVLWT
jgi:hypothetical protein